MLCADAQTKHSKRVLLMGTSGKSIILDAWAALRYYDVR